MPMPATGHIANFRATRAQVQRRFDTITTEIRDILSDAKTAGRADLTPAEDRTVHALFADRDRAKDQLAELDGKIDRWTGDAADDRAVDRLLRQVDPNPDPRGIGTPSPYDRVARVGREERTYHAGNDPAASGKQFLLDVTRQAMFNDLGASERLARHMREEMVERPGYAERAVGTGAYAGLVVPQYLTDQYAPAVATLRPIADIATRHDLPPEGMTVNISRITTSSSVALQASENTAVSETNMDDTLLTVNVQTAAGQQTVSRQAIERGTGVEEVTLSDLMKRYASALDSTIITQAVTGLANVAQGTTYTDAAPVAAALWPFLFQAQSKLEAALLGQAMPDYIAMHSRRWNWLCSQVGTSFPFIGSALVPPQTGGVTLTNQYGPGVRGVLSNGMKVIVDNNIETTVGGTQDPIYMLASGELHLWEDANAPVLIRAEQPLAASLGVLLVVYGFFGYTAQRYASNPGRITGSGLVAPSGF